MNKMKYKIHKGAKLTPFLRDKIHNSNKKINELAQQYNVSENTIRKWKKRTDFEDRSSSRKKLCLTLTEFEEALICEVKKSTLFSAYDLQEILKPFIPQLNKDNLYRCLKRNGLNRNNLITNKLNNNKKDAKNEEYLRIDVKELPKINNERRYIFIAIDKKTRICIPKIYNNNDTQSALDFLEYCIKFLPFSITKVLTDNYKCFTNSLNKNKTFSIDKHPFDIACGKYNIKHILTKLYFPDTTNVIKKEQKRFNEDVLSCFNFNSYSELQTNLFQYIYKYNFVIKQTALNSLSPIDFLIKNININSEKYKNINDFAYNFMNLLLNNDTLNESQIKRKKRNNKLKLLDDINQKFEIVSSICNYFCKYIDIPISFYESIINKGELKTYTANYILKRSNSIESKIRFIIKGSCGYFVKVKEEEKCVYFIFENDFVVDYISLFYNVESGIIIKTLEKTEIFEISKSDFLSITENKIYGEKLRRVAAELLFIDTQQQYLDAINLSATERYLKLQERNKNIFQKIDQKHIASFLGIAPQSLSRLRKKLLRGK